MGQTGTPPGPRNSGRPPNSWDQKLTSYCRYKNFGNWVDAAEDQPWRQSHLADFIYFCRLWADIFGTYYVICSHAISFSHLCPLGPDIFLADGLDSAQLDSFVSYSANSAFVCHAHASLMRWYEMKWSQMTMKWNKMNFRATHCNEMKWDEWNGTQMRPKLEEPWKQM